MRVARILGMLGLLALLVPRPAGTNLWCKWFNRCLYEAPAFSFKVVDKETGQPLAEVHALAEWVQYGAWGRWAGSVMVLDAVSGPDGILRFPAWGPIQGSSAGLVINHDPVITLFKPGYVVPRLDGHGARIISNVVPDRIEETTRVRPFGQDGQTLVMEPFRGTAEEWVKEAKSVAWGASHSRSADPTQQFREPYMNRLRRVRAELQRVPRTSREIETEIRFFEDSYRDMEGLR